MAVTNDGNITGEPASPRSRRPVHVLLVEDDKDVLALMKAELEWVGFAVSAAADGQTALEMATREAPDMIVSDIGMPRLDGYQLLKKLRTIPSLGLVPAIALTGFGRQRDVEQANDAGFTEHMVKPVDLTELIAAIRRLTHGITS